jgi:tetratricopeptide (TPR) repeat protein
MFSPERDARIDHLETLDLAGLLELERESPRDVDLLVRIAIQCFKQRRFKECYEYFCRALAINPDDGWTHLYVGTLWSGLGCHDEAVTHFQRAATLLPDVACPHWCLGDAYAKQGYISRTESHYRRAVEIDPTDAKANQKLQDWLANKPTLE